MYFSLVMSLCIYRKVCNYIRQRSRDFQCVLISHKEQFLEKADALVGVCKGSMGGDSGGMQSSRVLSLDLRPFLAE